ncbi:MAG: archaemetzincin family Zn-dependent metalloprotease [Candidatus Geothermarchaeales archaeon]
MPLTILLQPIGEVPSRILEHLKHNLGIAFDPAECTIAERQLPIPEASYNPKRGQYLSSNILRELAISSTDLPFNRVLGILDADAYVPDLNFVFGEAQCPGKAALIALHRLRPEFYGEEANEDLFFNRVLKEAIHELGHTLGFGHCGDRFCIMWFSNSIYETDRKTPRFCEKCLNKLTWLK